MGRSLMVPNDSDVRCYKCGGMHHTDDCIMTAKKDAEKKKSLLCNACGKLGHQRKDCPTHQRGLEQQRRDTNEKVNKSLLILQPERTHFYFNVCEFKIV